jgi:hypothetical protein
MVPAEPRSRGEIRHARVVAETRTPLGHPVRLQAAPDPPM